MKNLILLLLSGLLWACTQNAPTMSHHTPEASKAFTQKVAEQASPYFSWGLEVGGG